MPTDLQPFVRRFIGTVALALVPVVLTAFVSMPLSLSRHPGELAQHGATATHMT